MFGCPHGRTPGRPVARRAAIAESRGFMYASNTTTIRMATGEDAGRLRHLADSDGEAPLEGPVLVGEIAGTPVAALALTDGRAIADPFVPTDHLVGTLRVRAKGIRAAHETPSLRARLLAALRPVRRASAGAR